MSAEKRRAPQPVEAEFNPDMFYGLESYHPDTCRVEPVDLYPVALRTPGRQTVEAAQEIIERPFLTLLPRLEAKTAPSEVAAAMMGLATMTERIAIRVQNDDGPFVRPAVERISIAMRILGKRLKRRETRRVAGKGELQLW